MGAVSVFVALFCLIIPSYADTDIPLNSRIYPLLNDLQYSGYITGHLVGSKPISSNEVRRLIREAKEGLSLGNQREDSRPYLTQPMEAVGRGISLGIGDEWFQFKPLTSPEIKYIYLNGENSSIVGINASQNSLIYNNDGIDPEEGSNGYLSFSVEGKAGPISFSVTPLFSIDGAAKGIIHKGYVKLHTWGLDLEAGKIPLWWGQGYHGTLFLSNNAEPLPMVRLTNPSPILLPWVFKYLGPLFYGELGGEDQRGFLPSFPFAYIIGAYVPLLDRGIDFRVEYADVRSAKWYSHEVYRSGYTYKGRVLGHHVGRGGRDLFAEMGFLKGKRLNGKINFDYENRGIETQPIKEKHYQLGTNWEYMVGKALVDWRMNVDLAYERITNFNNISGDDRNNSLISFSITGGI